MLRVRLCTVALYVATYVRNSSSKSVASNWPNHSVVGSYRARRSTQALRALTPRLATCGLGPSERHLGSALAGLHARGRLARRAPRLLWSQIAPRTGAPPSPYSAPRRCAGADATAQSSSLHRGAALARSGGSGCASLAMRARRIAWHRTRIFGAQMTHRMASVGRGARGTGFKSHGARTCHLPWTARDAGRTVSIRPFMACINSGSVLCRGPCHRRTSRSASVRETCSNRADSLRASNRSR